LQSWVGSAYALLVPGGILCLVNRADALQETLACVASRFGGIRLWPVHPTETAPASRILLTARRGSRTPLSVMPGLALHQASGGWTPRADAILRGEAELSV
jgi:tRNA1(Val) A37 N6-methylase TrmN6